MSRPVKRPLDLSASPGDDEEPSPGPPQKRAPHLRPLRSLSPPPTSTASNNGAAKIDDDDEDEEEDYMSMIVADAPTGRETLTQRQKRLQREREIRGRPLSKAELAKQEKEKREAALAKSILEKQNKGLRMMEKMGYKSGSGLGRASANGEARIEPVGITMKEDRGGIGMAQEQARRVREAMGKEGDAEEKKEEVDPEVYRQRVAEEREERRCEGLFYAAQKVAEKLDMEAQGVAEEDIGKKREVPLKAINILWRGAVRYRENKEAARRLKHEMLQSLTTPLSELDAEDRNALGLGNVTEEDLDVEEEDEELDQFEAKPFKERLGMVVQYLRDRYNYCFWCKYKYPDEAMDGCPGTDEDSHG